MAADDTRFHWWMTGAHLWILGGLFLDGWHHINDPGLETFFTPWHGVLYSGVGIAMAIVTDQALRGRRRGLSWRQAIPAGYGLSVIGGAIFAAGGVADMVWHELLGVEVGVEALLSPTHLTLAVAGALVFAAPLRAAWRARSPQLWPAVVSVAGVVAMLGFFTQYVHPFTHLYPTLAGAGDTADLRHAAGIAGIILHGAIMVGAVLVPALRWRLPTGAVAVILVLPALLMTTQRGTYELLPGVILAAIAAETLVAVRRPSRRDPNAIRLSAALVPAFVFSAYFATLAVGGTLVWSVHLVTGGVAVAAAAGTFVGLLLLVPGEPALAPDPEPHTAARQTAALR